LHDDDERALVLAGHRITRRQELDAVALHRPADRDIDLERRLAQRLRVDATVFLDRHRQHLVEQDVGVVEAHRCVRRHFARAFHLLVARLQLLDQLGNSRLQRLRIDQLRRRGVGRMEVVDVVAEGLAQLVNLAMAGAVADQRLELQALLLCLPQEERDVRVVAGMQDDVGAGALELRHQARKVGRGRRVAFLHDDVHAHLLAFDVVRRGDAGAVRTVFVDDGDAHVLRRNAELRLRVVVDVFAGGLPVLIAVHGRPEDVLELLVLQHRARDADVQPEEFLARIRLLRHRHALRARVDAGDDVDLLLVDEPRHLVDRDIDLRLRVGEDGVDLVAIHTAMLVDVIDCRLGADLGRLGAAAGERTRDVVDKADLDFFLLCVGGERARRQGDCE
jgi:hypothetical protein